MYNKYVGYSPDSEKSWKEDIKKLNLDNPKVCFTTDEKDTKKLNPED